MWQALNRMANGEQICFPILALSTRMKQNYRSETHYWAPKPKRRLILNKDFQHMSELCDCILRSSYNNNLVCVTNKSVGFCHHFAYWKRCELSLWVQWKNMETRLSLMSFLYDVPALLFPQMNSALFSKQSFHCLKCISDHWVII